MTEYLSFFETGLGTGIVLASGQGVRRMHLPHDSVSGSCLRDGLELKKYLLQMEGVEFKGELICQEK